MQKRLFLFLGLIALFLVLMTGLTGCSSDPGYKFEYTFYNRSSYNIHVDIDPGYDVNPKSFDIKPGATQKCGGNTTDYTHGQTFHFNWQITDTNYGNGVRFDESSMTWYNR